MKNNLYITIKLVLRPNVKISRSPNPTYFRSVWFLYTYLFPPLAPCPPAQLSVAPRTVVNGTQILRATWSTVNCSKSEYLLALKGCIHGNHNAQSDLTSYWTVRTFFEIPLPCGSSYSATIRARNFAATSDESAAVNGTTGAQYQHNCTTFLLA